ncbi:uncharacterized protein LOC125546171 [Triticum urartu]|nr:uncharacterized protein LOC125546171 [Triticum urartu]
MKSVSPPPCLPPANCIDLVIQAVSICQFWVVRPPTTLIVLVRRTPPLLLTALSTPFPDQFLHVATTARRDWGPPLGRERLDSSYSSLPSPPRKMEPALVDEKLIPWELNKFKLNPLRNGGVIAYYQINKPSDLTATAQLAPKDRPLVCLHLKESENLPKISIMNLRHRNILRVEAVQKLELPFSNQKNIAVVVEPHDGPLTWFLVRLLLTEKGSNAVPSQSLRDVIRQIVEAIEELRINGVYHGNLTIHNIYHSRVGGAIVVKLVNFQNRDIELEAAQLMDWVGLGNILHTISTAAKFRDNTASCSIIDHLASKLMALTSINCLPSIKKGTLDDMLQG